MQNNQNESNIDVPRHRFKQACGVPMCKGIVTTSLHLLPNERNKKMRNCWIKLLKLNKRRINKKFKVCNNHFLESDFCSPNNKGK